MVYSEDDLLWSQGNEDVVLPNKESDIKSRCYSDKTRDQDGEDGGARAALDVLAVRFGPDLLDVLLEPSKTKPSVRRLAAEGKWHPCVGRYGRR